MELFVEEKCTCGQKLGKKMNVSPSGGDRVPASPGWKVAGCLVLGLVAWGIQGCERKSSGVRTVELLKQMEQAQTDLTAEQAPDAGLSKAAVQHESATKDQPFVNSLGMKFVPVSITGGPTSGTRVLFSVWETRRQDYEKFAAEAGRLNDSWKHASKVWKKAGHEPDHPVVCVGWEDANRFCAWLTKKDRAAGKIGLNHEYRLPTDHEWSCAVGIGRQENAAQTPRQKHSMIAGVYPWGTQWLPPDRVGNYCGQETKGRFGETIDGYTDGYATTSPAGSFPASGDGIHDLGGNVWEWCEDFYDGGKDFHMLRGGGWMSHSRDAMSSAARIFSEGGTHDINHGFRCVLASVQEG